MSSSSLVVGRHNFTTDQYCTRSMSSPKLQCSSFCKVKAHTAPPSQGTYATSSSTLSRHSAVQAAVGCSDGSTLWCPHTAGLANQRWPGRQRGLVCRVKPVHGSPTTVRAPAPYTVLRFHARLAARRMSGASGCRSYSPETRHSYFTALDAHFAWRAGRKHKVHVCLQLLQTAGQAS